MFCLKTVETIGNCQRLVFTVGVSQHMHKITNRCKFELNRSSKLRDNNERKNTLRHTNLCAFWCLISRPQVLNLRSRNQIRGKLLISRKLRHFRGSCSNSWKITDFSKTTSLQRELFLTMFYTINLSPILVLKKGFMMIIILSNYQ